MKRIFYTNFKKNLWIKECETKIEKFVFLERDWSKPNIFNQIEFETYVKTSTSTYSCMVHHWPIVLLNYLLWMTNYFFCGTYWLFKYQSLVFIPFCDSSFLTDEFVIILWVNFITINRLCQVKYSLGHHRMRASYACEGREFITLPVRQDLQTPQSACAFYSVQEWNIGVSAQQGSSTSCSRSVAE